MYIAKAYSVTTNSFNSFSLMITVVEVVLPLYIKSVHTSQIGSEEDGRCLNVRCYIDIYMTVYNKPLIIKIIVLKSDSKMGIQCKANDKHKTSIKSIGSIGFWPEKMMVKE